MTAREYMEWSIYSQQNPLPIQKLDIYVGLIIHAIMTAAGQKIKLDDVIPKWNTPEQGGNALDNLKKEIGKKYGF